MIDLLTSAAQYRAHLLPIFLALPAAARGEDHRLNGAREPAGNRGDAVLVGSGRDLVRAQALGYKRIAYAEHGIGQSYDVKHPAYPGGIKRNAVGLFLSPNKTAARADSEAYPDAWVSVIGDPRLDTLPTARSDANAVAFSFHWDCAVAPETRTAFHYFRQALAALRGRYPLLGHAHPKIEPVVRHWCQREGIPFTSDFDEVVRRARLYICDNSSTIYEFAATGRPVVLLNAPWYRREVELGLRFWEAADVGLQVDSPADLLEKVQVALEDPPGVRANRESALELAYGFRSGAAQRAAWAIGQWL